MAYDGEIRIKTKVDTSQMQKLQVQIDKATNKVAALTAKYEELKNKKIPTDDYLEIQKQIDATQVRLDKLLAKKESFRGSHKSASWLNMNSEIEELQASLPYLKGELQDLIDTGKAFTLGSDSDEFRKVSSELSLAQKELRALQTKQAEMVSKGGKISDGFKKIAEAGKKAFRSIQPEIKKSNGMLSTFTSRLKGILLSLFIFNWVTKAFNAMVSGIKEGFKNLVKYSDEYNQSVSGLVSVNTQIKNSFATAFAPIVQMVIPHLITLMNYITLTSNKIAQFMAVISGSKTWIKATAVQEDYAASLGGTAAAAKKVMGVLASFDSIEVLNKKDTPGGSGGSGTKPEDMFEEIPIDQNSEISNLAKRVKELIGNEDWYGLGALIGEKINDALNGINWEAIKEKAGEMGRNLANFLNGGIETINWDLVGATLAEGLNTAIEFLYNFADEFHWDSLGLAIANSLNGFFRTFDFAKAGLTLSKFALGLLMTMLTAVRKTDWGKIGKSIAIFLDAIEWKELFKTVGELIVSSLIACIDFAKGFGDNSDGIAKNIVDGFIAAKIASKVGKALKLSLGQTFVLGLFGFSMKEAMDDMSKSANKAEELLAAMPKQEDYENVLGYSQAMAEWREELDSFNNTNFQFSGIDYDENGWNESLVEIKDKVKEWWTESVIPIFTTDGYDIAKQNAANGEEWIRTFVDGVKNWWGTNIVSFWNECVTPWFAAEKWYELGQGILDGLPLKWAEFIAWWNETAVVLWWEENVVPWFSAETWLELAQGIVDGISEKWTELSAWWGTNITAWWNEQVAPWFTVEKWKQLGDNIKKGIYNGFCGILGKVESIINALITGFENMCNKIIDAINEIIREWNGMAGRLESFHIDTFSRLDMGRVKFDIPALANGAVLRGGNPFLAILGDQPAGQTNIEAPQSAIEEAVANGMRGNGAARNVTVNINYNGETFARAFLPDFLAEMDRQGYDVDILGGLT